MRTKVVHNRFHFDHPVVVLVDARVFFLVFPRGAGQALDGHAFRVVADWPFGDLDPASSVAIRCQAVAEDGGADGGCRWELRIADENAEDPRWGVLLNGTDEWAGLKWRSDGGGGGDGGLETGRPFFRHPGCFVSAGDAVELVFGAEAGIIDHYSHAFKFSLFKEEDEPVVEAEAGEVAHNDEEEEIQGIGALPEELVRDIVDYLPAWDVLELLPHVSRQFHRLARRRTAWPVLSVSTLLGVNCAPDTVCLIENARGSCKFLTIDCDHADDRHDYINEDVNGVEQLFAVDPAVDANEIVRCIAAGSPWPRLRKLRICEPDAEHCPQLRMALWLTSDNIHLFPVLEELTIFPAGDRDVFEFFDNCLFPGVKSLTMQVRNSQHFRTDPDSQQEAPAQLHTPEDFFSRLPNLQRLTLQYADTEDEVMFPGLQSGLSSPQLKELRLSLYGEDALARILTFQLAHLEVLSLEVTPNSPAASTSPPLMRVCAQSLLSNFPKLAKISIHPPLEVAWAQAEPRLLERLTFFCGHPSEDLPLGAMVNLEAASLYLRHDLLNCPVFRYPTWLSNLTAVQILEWGDDQAFLTALLQMAEPLPRVTTMEVGEPLSISFNTCHAISRLLDFMPRLERLSLNVSFPQPLTEALCQRIALRMSSLQSLVLENGGRNFAETVGILQFEFSALGFRTRVSRRGRRAWFWKPGTVEPWKKKSVFAGTSSMCPHRGGFPNFVGKYPRARGGDHDSDDED